MSAAWLCELLTVLELQSTLSFKVRWGLGIGWVDMRNKHERREIRQHVYVSDPA